MIYPCIGLGSGIGAGTFGSGAAPEFLKKHLDCQKLHWRKILVPDEIPKNKFDHIANINRQFAKEAMNLAKEISFFFSFGGDHSTALGTWSGAAEGYRDLGDLGLIWMDAHMDMHTEKTSESGNIHGMPLAALMGYGDKRLTGILSTAPKVKPENTALIGIRSFEDPELQLAKQLGVTIYFIEDVIEKGLESILDEVINNLSRKTAGYGVSFDLDMVDPAFVKGTGTPVSNGVHADEAIAAMGLFVKHPPAAFELVEYNPLLDEDQETFRFIQNLLEPLTGIEIHSKDVFAGSKEFCKLTN